MSDNPFEKLNQSLNDLAQTLENNADVIADKIRKKKQAQQLADGSITQEDAFAQDVQFAKGEMKSFYCTHCGSPIRIHEKLSTSFCRICGYAVEIANARSGKFDDTAIAQMDGALLYQLSKEKRYHRETLLHAAAKKGHLEANRDLALASAFEYEYDDAINYARVGEKQNDPDCMCCMLACKIGKGKADNAEDLLAKLRKIGNKNLHTEKGKELYKITETVLQDRIAEQREIQRQRDAAQQASIVASVCRSINEPKLEPTIWSDWRNGESLYRRSTDGKIVNGAGEEVSVAWWD